MMVGRNQGGEKPEVRGRRSEGRNGEAGKRRRGDVTKQLSKLMEMLKDLTLKGFYGSMQIKFENGKIVHVKKEESIKLN